jgi:hypothetical protein
VASVNRLLEWSPVRVGPDGKVIVAGRETSGPHHRSNDERRGVPVARETVAEFLDAATEDSSTEHVIAPLLRLAGFSHVRPKGHRDKSGEYGQDIRQMKLRLPTAHELFFAVQIKTGNLNARSSSTTQHIETLLTQARTALNKKTWDDSRQSMVAVNHVIIVATGAITEQARTYLYEQLEASNRSVMFLDRDGLLDLVERHGLPEGNVRFIGSALVK